MKILVGHWMVHQALQDNLIPPNAMVVFLVTMPSKCPLAAVYWQTSHINTAIPYSSPVKTLPSVMIKLHTAQPPWPVNTLESPLRSCLPSSSQSSSWSSTSVQLMETWQHSMAVDYPNTPSKVFAKGMVWALPSGWPSACAWFICFIRLALPLRYPALSHLQALLWFPSFMLMIVISLSWLPLWSQPPRGP